MPGLRALLDFPDGSGNVLDYSTIYVYNTGKVDPNNGGQCCLFTVPTGVSWIAVEMWGGGGGGAGACCCQQGWPGGAGSYSRKFITNASEGQQYTLCAGGSSCCASSCRGCGGFPSYVSVSGGSVEACASGGAGGRTRCEFADGCSYSGCQQQQCGSYIGTMGICGTAYGAKGSAMCGQSAWQLTPSAPYTPGGSRGSSSLCANCHGCQVGGPPHWPGGAGASASAHSGCSWNGSNGAGGLVVLYYGAKN